MTDTDSIIRRWRANAEAAGVRLTDADIERIAGRGTVARVALVEEIVARANASGLAPDYLGTLATYTEEPDDA